MTEKVDWPELLELIDVSATTIKAKYPEIDTIIAISRGGLIPASLISRKLNIKRIYSLGITSYDRNNKQKKCPEIYQQLPSTLWSSNILIVDDIIDSGASMKYAIDCINKRHHSDRDPITYSVFYKRILLENGYISTSQPILFSREVDRDVWIIMPWEII